MSQNSEEIKWNLGQVIPNATEEKLKSLAKNNEESIDLLSIKYDPFLDKDSLKANEIKQLLEDFEELLIDTHDLIIYGGLSFAANTSLKLNQIAMNFALNIKSKIKRLSIKFKLKINQILMSNSELLRDPILHEYKPYLEKELEKFRHQLNMNTEELIIEKDRFGISELVELRNKWLNSQEYSITIDDQIRQYSYGKIMGLFHDSNSQVREAAIKSLYSKVECDQEIYSTVFRSICNDWVLISKRRKYQDPIHHSLIIGNIDRQSIEDLMLIMEQNVSLYQRYLKLKAQQLKVPVLSGSDRFAPPRIQSPKKYSWSQTKEIILNTFNSCDQELGNLVQKMFDSQRIDASPRQGKTNGAFCNYWLRDKSSFVLLSYNGHLNDIYTLAHELGHAVHSYLILRKQKPLNVSSGPIVAEIASKFGELILTDYLLGYFKTKDEKIQVLTEILDFNGFSMFWGSLRFWFEKSVYEAIERNVFLDGDTINQYYVAARQKVYGDAMMFPEKMKWEWATTPHYYIPDLKFYNYPYIFALIFVYNCFQEYKRNKVQFMPKFKTVLEAGGSMSPQEIASYLGFKKIGSSFWKSGLQQYSKLTDEFESLIRED
ncbi:MAG: M3 family metallopeptidase [Promethearchaeota archaeon]